MAAILAVLITLLLAPASLILCGISVWKGGVTTELHYETYLISSGWGRCSSRQYSSGNIFLAIPQDHSLGQGCTRGIVRRS